MGDFETKNKKNNKKNSKKQAKMGVFSAKMGQKVAFLKRKTTKNTPKTAKKGLKTAKKQQFLSESLSQNKQKTTFLGDLGRSWEFWQGHSKPDKLHD